MSKSNLQFNVSASLIRRLGEIIVPDVVAALTELIKNAYDADANQVTIEIITQQTITSPTPYFKTSSPGFVRVEDNGSGMSWAEVQNSWMNFSYSQKKELKAKEPTEKKRSPVGGQGMGRLGTARLGDCVELFTRQADENLSHVAFDWNQFSDDQTLAEVFVLAEQISNSELTGTQILIYPLKDPELWTTQGQEFVNQVRNKVTQFSDRSSFRVVISIDGKKFQLAEPVVTQVPGLVTIENVWQKMTPQLIDEVIRFWNDNKMLRPGFSSEERARQVVLVIRSEADRKIVGLSTADTVTYKQLNNNTFYLYRSIVLPGYRHPGLASKIIVESRDFLESYTKASKNPCIGILTFIENPKIQQFRREAIWHASKMAYLGMDKQGRHIRVYYFKGATI